MKNLSDEDILELNGLLHKLLGIEGIEFCGKEIIGEDFLAEKRGSDYFTLNKQKTLETLKKGSSDILLKLYRILHFYYPRWIAYSAIHQSDDKYKDYSANNQLLFGLTSIIDWLNESKRGHYTEGFSNFLKKNLSQGDLSALLTERNIQKRQRKG